MADTVDAGFLCLQYLSRAIVSSAQHNHASQRKRGVIVADTQREFGAEARPR
jgi:hypothetical protein